MPSMGCILPFGIEDSDSVNESNKESMDTNCKPLLEKNETECATDSDNGFDSLSPELIDRIVSQVEFYFSDANLIKDEFISKHIRRNKDGFISLKLLSSLRKVKVITKDCKLVAHCIRLASKTLELNDTDTKIRRKAPLPALEGDKYSRTVVAYNMAVGSDNIESICKEFSQFGDIALIRILKNSSVINSNQLKMIANKYDLSKTIIATIEYNNKSSAEEALRRMKQSKSNNWRNGIEVMPLKSASVMANKNHFKDNDNSENGENLNPRKYYKSNDNTNTSYTNNTYKRPIFMRQKSKSYSSADEKQVLENVFKRPFDKNAPKVETSNGLKLPPNVIRMPRGPDGTNGFNSNRNHRSNSEP